MSGWVEGRAIGQSAQDGRGGRGQGRGGDGGVDALSAKELAGAVERILSRLDVPLSLEKKELLQSVLELREQVDSG